MEGEVVKIEKAVELRDSRAAKKKSRAALHNMLSNDEEYANMEEHVIVDESITDNLDKEVSEETRLVNVTNILKLVYLDVQGYGVGALAKEMQLSPTDVQLIRRSSAFRSAKDAMMAAIVEKSRNMLEVTTMKAVKTLMECMEKGNDKVKLAAAVEVLNRTGINAPQKIELTTTTNNMMNFTEDELAEIIRSSQAIPGTAEVIPDGNK